MYSKDKGITYDAGQPFPRRQPAYRQPDRPRMQVPPNYSGHAIVDGEERPLGQIAEAEPAPESVPAEGPTPRFDDLPRVSDLGDRRRPPARTLPATFEESVGEAEREEPSVPPDAVPAVPAAATPLPTAPTAPTSAPRGVFDLSRFPFGHGIGFEELLILGLILFLLHESGECEDRGDIDETVILLGLLLLLG